MFLVMFSENVYEWALDKQKYGVTLLEHMGKSQKTLSYKFGIGYLKRPINVPIQFYNTNVTFHCIQVPPEYSIINIRPVPLGLSGM